MHVQRSPAKPASPPPLSDKVEAVLRLHAGQDIGAVRTTSASPSLHRIPSGETPAASCFSWGGTSACAVAMAAVARTRESCRGKASDHGMPTGMFPKRLSPRTRPPSPQIVKRGLHATVICTPGSGGMRPRTLEPSCKGSGQAPSYAYSSFIK